MNTKFFKYAGIAASVLLIAFGIGMVATGKSAQSTVHDNLAQEHIKGTPDMTPAGIAAAVKESKLTGITLPTCSVANKPVNDGASAKCFASYMRIHALEATGGRTFSQMGQYLTAQGKETSDKTQAGTDPKTGQPIPNAARNVWVTETALGTALNTSYFASSVGTVRDHRRHRPAADRHRAARSHGALDPRAEARRGQAADPRGPDRAGSGMRALVYHGPGERAWDTVPDPVIVDPTDAVVRIDTSTICGSDLHILKGDVPETPPGTVLGHEAVGTVEAVGAGVTTVAPGDRVLVSCISACGRCRFCKEAHYGQCLGGGGWVLGHTIDGLQAEYARTPFADTSLYKLPDAMSDEQALFLADILPTSYEVGVLNGAVGPGDVLAIVGAGPIGLAAVLTAGLLSPSRIAVIDLDDGRLARAREFGADVTINNGTEDAVARIMELTDGMGADVALEAVGIAPTFELAAELIRPGGHVANIGVHGHSACLHLETMWSRNVTITTGLVDTFTIPQLMRLVAQGRLDPTVLATHRYALGDTMAAYDTFADAGTTGALKVVLQGAGVTHAEPVEEAVLVAG